MKNTDENSIENINDGTSVIDEGWPIFSEHSLLEGAISEATRELQISREMAIMCAFGAMATACQGHVDLKMPTGHKIPTALMLLTIADSGERKTTTQNYFSEAISASNDEAYQNYKAALIEHEVKHKLWQAHKRHLERAYIKCANQEDETLTREALQALEKYIRTEPRPARSGKFLYEDSSPQALVQMLYENAPNGCLLSSEANSIFSGKVLGELDKLNTLWDGGSVIVDRISREGFILKNARLTLSVMAQPSVIAKFMDKRGEEARGTGFLARLLVAKPRPKAGYRQDMKQSDLPRRKAFNTRISERLTLSTPLNRQELRFSETAANRWYEYSQTLEEEMQENGLYYYLKDHASKLLENTSRLAAILHTFERSSCSDIDINLETLESSWKLAKMCSGHFIRYLANEPQIVTDANNLSHFLLQRAHKQNPTAGEDAPGTIQKPHTNWGSDLPENLMAGVEISFMLSDVKKLGPSSLRGRVNDQRLASAIDLLTKLGHIQKTGSRYKFKETILISSGEPQLKNGEIITIKELPLFSEQIYSTPDRAKAFSLQAGYYLKVGS